MVYYLFNRLCIPQRKLQGIRRISLTMRDKTEVSLGSVSIHIDN